MAARQLGALLLLLFLGTSTVAHAGVVGDAEEVLESLPSDSNGGQAPVLPHQSGSQFPTSQATTSSSTRNTGNSKSPLRADAMSSSAGQGGSLGSGEIATPLQPAPEVLKRRMAQRQSDNLWSFMGLLLLFLLVAAAAFFGRNVERGD